MKKKYEIISARFRDLKEGEDYEVLTVQVTDTNVRTIPYGRFFKKDILDIINLKGRVDSIVHMIEMQENDERVLVIQSSRPPKSGQLVFLVEGSSIDFDTAVDCGFGIFKMLKGQYKDKYFLYNCENDLDNESIMLDVYLQIVVDEYDNVNLDKAFSTNTGKTTLLALKHTDDNALMNKLEKALQKNKGGDNIVEFKEQKA